MKRFIKLVWGTAHKTIPAYYYNAGRLQCLQDYNIPIDLPLSEGTYNHEQIIAALSGASSDPIDRVNMLQPLAEWNYHDVVSGDGSAVYSAVAKLAPFMADPRHDMRTYLASVVIRGRVVTASDGHTLGLEKFTCDLIPAQFPAWIVKAMALIEKKVRSWEYQTTGKTLIVRVVFKDDTHAVFQSGELGGYPDFERVLGHGVNRTTVNYAAESKLKAHVKKMVAAGKLEGQKFWGDAESVAMFQDGINFPKMGANPVYLLRALDYLGVSGTRVYYPETDNDPIFCQNGERVAVVMPVRI